jgi:4-amino-4-deoxy-L-arabinose transferase-like glycosyltransferase
MTFFHINKILLLYSEIIKMNFISLISNLFHNVICKIVATIQKPYFLYCLFTIFVSIRLALIILIPIEPHSDAGWYYARAQTLLQEGTYSEGGIKTAFWPVGYPAFLTFSFFLAGNSILVAQIANLIIAAFSFWLVYYLAKRLFKCENTAIISVLFLTFYPNNIAYTSLLLSETLYTFLLLLCVTLLLWRNHLIIHILIGILFGFAILTKTQTVLLIPLILTLFFCKKIDTRYLFPALARPLLILSIAVLTVLPWTKLEITMFLDQ